MLCDVVFVSFHDDGNLDVEVVEHAVDLDYWNIRQWRRLYCLLSKRLEKRLVKLEIRPIIKDATF